MSFDKASLAKFGVMLCLCAGVLAARVLGTLDFAYAFQHYIGYYLVLAVVVCWGYFLSRKTPGFRTSIELLKSHSAGICVIAGSCIFMQLHEPHVLRVLHDESTHAAGALVMHLDKAAFIPAKAHYVAGAYMLMEYYGTFRQYLFQVLLSLLHDITGYRVANVYVLNCILSLLLLSAAYIGTFKIAGKFGAIIAVGLLGALPLLAQNVNSGGYDVLNVALIAVLFCCCINYARANETSDRLAALNTGTATAILLSLSRYESILYLIFWALVVAIKWRQIRRIELTWFASLSPIFILPNLVSHLILFSSQLVNSESKDLGGRKYFEIGYIRSHLEDAVFYFFNQTHQSSNSALLSLAGFLGALFLFVTVARSAKSRSIPGNGLLAGLVLWTGGVYLLILSQYWSSPTDSLAARFTLPLFLCAALCAGWFSQQFAAHSSFRRAAYGVLAIWTILFTAPAESHAVPTNTMVVSRAERWMLQQAKKYDREATLFVARSNVHFIAYRYATIPLDNLVAEPWKAVRIVKAGIYKQVLVYQLQQVDLLTGKWVAKDNASFGSLVLKEVASEPVGPAYRAVLYELIGYRTDSGAVITPSDDEPQIRLRTRFASEAELDRYRQSLYP